MIFITGDMHGLMERFQDSAFRHIKKGDTLIICGDFGFLWEGTEEEKKALKKLEKKKYEILFVDGIHENFDLLESYPEEEYAGGKGSPYRYESPPSDAGRAVHHRGKKDLCLWRRGEHRKGGPGQGGKMVGAGNAHPGGNAARRGPAG